jgi:Methyl-accepting chemotaxis protein
VEEKRRSKVVNPKLQYREALSTVMVFVITVNLLIIFLSFSPSFFGGTVRLPFWGYFSIAVAEVIFVIAMWRASIRSTHRLAGPVYAACRELSRLKEGDLTVQVQLRPNDEFQELAEAINDGVGHIRKEVDELKKLVDALDPQFSDMQSVSEIKDRLSRLTTTAKS